MLNCSALVGSPRLQLSIFSEADLSCLHHFADNVDRMTYKNMAKTQRRRVGTTMEFKIHLRLITVDSIADVKRLPTFINSHSVTYMNRIGFLVVFFWPLKGQVNMF